MVKPAEADPIPEDEISTGLDMHRVNGLVEFVRTPRLSAAPAVPCYCWSDRSPVSSKNNQVE
jgi:hypothetical protein